MYNLFICWQSFQLTVFYLTVGVVQMIAYLNGSAEFTFCVHLLSSVLRVVHLHTTIIKWLVWDWHEQVIKQHLHIAYTQEIHLHEIYQVYYILCHNCCLDNWTHEESCKVMLHHQIYWESIAYTIINDVIIW